MSDSAFDRIKARLDKSTKGTRMTILSESALSGEVVKISTPTYDLNRILSGSLYTGVVSRTHTLLVGPEACLDEDTHISFEVVDDKGYRDHKGGKIKNLYRRFHNNKTDRVFRVMSVNENDCIISNNIFDVVKTGIKECFELVTEGGYSIRTSKDHKFYVGDGEYKSLENLNIGDNVYIHTNHRNKKEVKKKLVHKDMCVKYYPNDRIKIINDCYYHRVKECNMVYESMLNNMSFDEFRTFLNKGSKEDIDNILRIPSDKVLHHIDKNSENNTLSNLIVLDEREHLQLHANDGHNNLRFKCVSDKVVSITKVGNKETYDIKCLAPYNNYVANNIIVHNSGKSSFMCINLAEAQKLGYTPIIIDAEGAWTPEFVSRWGIDPTRAIIISTPWVEDIMVELANIINNGDTKMAIALDSIGALESIKMINDGVDGDVKADQGGLQRKIKRLMKMMVDITKRQDSISFSAGHYYGNPTGYGDPEKIGGGFYPKLAADYIVTLKKSAIYENGASKAVKDRGPVIGTRIYAATIKNRYTPPFQESVIEISYQNGVNKLAGLIDVATTMGLIEKGGAWYTVPCMGDYKVQGEAALYEAFKTVDVTPLLVEIEKILKTRGYSSVNTSLESLGEGSDDHTKDNIEEDTTPIEPTTPAKKIGKKK